MLKYIHHLLILVLFTGLRSAAQEKKLSAVQEQQRLALGMTSGQYNQFNKGMHDYNRQFMDIHTNTTMSPAEKKEALKKLRAESSRYVQRSLTPEQQKKISELRRKRAAEARPTAAMREAMFKKRGFKPVVREHKKITDR
jgi:hypothetical protein